jgi:CheY-like chemotaxis protein
MDRSLVTILIIDESVMVRRVLETLLEREGFSVLSVHSVPTAVQTMKAATIDLVLMDVSPSHQNAIVQTTGMRREFPDIKVIAMSGFFGGNPPSPSRLRAHACLSKPIRPEALRYSVHSLLAQHATPLPGVH